MTPESLVSAQGDATWWPRSRYPSAEAALIRHEQIEGSTPGDELLNAEGAERRLRIVWMHRVVGDPEGAIWLCTTVFGRLPDFDPASPDRMLESPPMECWEVV